MKRAALAALALLAARGFAARLCSSPFLLADFRAKERLLAVYNTTVSPELHYKKSASAGKNLFARTNITVHKLRCHNSTKGKDAFTICHRLSISERMFAPYEGYCVYSLFVSDIFATRTALKIGEYYSDIRQF